METLAPATLKQKNALELWSTRKKIAAELETLANNAEGRNYTTDEQALEERAVGNLKAIDSVIEENFRDMTMARYSGFGAQHLSSRDMAAVDWMKSAIAEKNPAAFTIEPEEKRDFSASQPGVERWESRDTLKSTATQALPVSVYEQFVLHLVEQTPVMRAGATVITTSTGENLVVPKSTAYQSGALTAEGVGIAESDPTLSTVTLGAYKP